MAQINVILNENKSIKQYSNQAFEGSQLATIDDADLASLGEYSDIMWVDDNGLVHAEDLPTTKYQDSLNKIKAEINQSQQQVSDDIKTLQSKSDEANKAIDQKMQSSTLMMMNFQNSIAKEIASAKTTTEQSPQSNTLNSEVQNDSNNAGTQK